MDYVVCDLEFCKVSHDKRRALGYDLSTETIQIGAVILKDGEITDNFNTFVRSEFGHMDYEIMKLTNISSKDLLDAPNMNEALVMFLDWIPEGAKVVSWSESDLQQIKYEAERKGITHERFDEIVENWIDCQAMFMEKISAERKYKLSEALIVADIDQEGQEHDGLTDAYNTAKLFAKMLKEPELKLNPFFVHAREETIERKGFSIADAFKDIKFD